MASIPKRYDEFSLIKQFFNQQVLTSDINLSVGDDCAIVTPTADQQIFISTDTVIAGVHFPLQTSAADIATKALAVNLSDLAAMGAKPAWFTLVLALPQWVDESWLQEFSSSLYALANQYQISLIGGDTSRSEQLAITIQVHGYGSKDHSLLRSKAYENDLIVVTGALGAAALGLQLVQGKIPKTRFSEQQQKDAIQALNCPKPRIEYGQIIKQYSHCAIDISDGLLADLGHIMQQSCYGAKINLEQIPVADCLSPLEREQALLLALTGGDDYELCFTIPVSQWLKMQKQQKQAANFYVIGKITKNPQLSLHNTHGQISSLAGVLIGKLTKGYNHFAE